MVRKNITKKGLIKVGTITTGVLVATSATFAAVSTSSDEAGLNDIEKTHKKMSPMNNLTVEEIVEIKSAMTQLKVNHLTEVISILDLKDVDTTEIEAILDDFKYLEEFLAEVDLDNTSKEELKDAFFELRPERESAKLVRDIVKENLSEEELEELKEGFRTDREELKEKYDLPEKKHKKGFRGNKSQQSSEEL